MEKRRAVCPHDCPDTCSLEVTIEGGRVTSLSGDANHPITKGVVCRKIREYPERLYGPQRIQRPLKRQGKKGEGSFFPISWDEAYDIISTKIEKILREYGGEAILPCSYAGTMGILNNASMDRRFFHRLGASNLERTICSAAGKAGYTLTMGKDLGVDPRTTLFSDLIIFWGSNAVSTNIHQWLLAREARKKRGSRIVVIDVHRNRTGSQGDYFYQILPGTDGALALGIANQLLVKGLLDEDFIASCTYGFDSFKERIGEFTKERVSAMTGLSPEEILELSSMYGSTKASLLRIGNGLQHHYNGGEAVRNISLLPALTGAWKVKGGGAMKGTSLASFNKDLLHCPELQLGPRRTFNLNRLGQALLTPDPPVKMLWVYNCNPAAVVPSLDKALRGLRREDLFTVVHEQVMTETLLYADLVLPATTMLEHLDIYRSYWHTYLQVSWPLIPPVGESRSNVRVFREMAARMGFQEPCFQDTEEEMIEQALDLSENHKRGITWERLKKEGYIDLNESQRPPVFDEEWKVPTWNGKIQFFSPLDRAFTPLERNIRYPLQLVNPPNYAFLNTTFSEIPRMRELEDRPLLQINPLDASFREIQDKDLVWVFNQKGEILIEAHVTDTVKPGVLVSLGIWPASYYYAREGNLNLLAPDDLADMGQGAVFFSTFVEVKKKETPWISGNGSG